MGGPNFPTTYYLDGLVRLLDTISYEDTNYTREERVECLKYAYGVAAKHFSDPYQLKTLNVPLKRLNASLQTIVGMVVYSWARVSKELMAALSIHYTYTLLLDDSTGDPHNDMNTFFDDLMQGNQQKHGWWKLVNEHFPNVLQHYGSFCGFNLIRSTFDFFEGCWIEQYNFHGFPGSYDFPLFLRRLNGLGHCVGASLFPKELFEEQKLFLEITSAIAQMENWMVFVNDLVSFYKEEDDPRDETSLINNYCHCEGLTVGQALEKLTNDTIVCSEQMVAVFKEKDAQVLDTLTSFVHGYCTWHLCDDRYRVKEIYEKCTGDSPNEVKFRAYYEGANAVGRIDKSEWALPSVIQLAEERAAASETNGNDIRQIEKKATTNGTTTTRQIASL